MGDLRLLQPLFAACLPSSPTGLTVHPSLPRSTSMEADSGASLLLAPHRVRPAGGVGRAWEILQLYLFFMDFRNCSTPWEVRGRLSAATDLGISSLAPSVHWYQTDLSVFYSGIGLGLLVCSMRANSTLSLGDFPCCYGFHKEFG